MPLNRAWVEKVDEEFRARVRSLEAERLRPVPPRSASTVMVTETWQGRLAPDANRKLLATSIGAPDDYEPPAERLRLVESPRRRRRAAG